MREHHANGGSKDDKNQRLAQNRGEQPTAARSQRQPDRHLDGLRNVTVVTSAVNIAAELAPDPEIDVIVTGGHMRGTTYALVGSLAEETLRGLHVNKLFLGGNGLTVANGLTTPDLSVATTDRAPAHCSARVSPTIPSPATFSE